MSDEEIIKELKHKIKVNEKSRRKMQQSLMKEIERLKSIIKEAREYIEERRKYKGEPFYLDEIQTEIVCEILDKVEEK